MSRSVLRTVLISLTLAACTGQSQIESDIEKLSNRLSSFTGISSDQYDTAVMLTAPAKHTLVSSVDDLQIAIRELYAVDDCPLGQFIAERNTSLGKVHLPSTRFIYEKELLRTMKLCIEQLEKDHRMQAKLGSWIAQKQHNLPSVWANMVTQSDEIYLAFTTGKGFVSGGSDDGLPGTRLALTQVIEALEKEEIDSSALELHLRELSNTRLPAKMWKTQQLLIHELPPVSRILEQYLSESPLTCSRSKQEELKIMRNIFTVFFADKVQALASQLNHYQYQLNPSFKRISKHPNIPDAWQRYIQYQYIDQAAAYKTVMQTHIELWQSVFKLCA